MTNVLRKYITLSVLILVAILSCTILFNIYNNTKIDNAFVISNESVLCDTKDNKLDTHQKLKFDVVYDGDVKEKPKVFRFEDKFIKPTNHIVYLDFFHRKINVGANEKIEYLKTLFENGYSAECAIQHTLPSMLDFVDKIESSLYKKPKDSKVNFKPDSTKMFDISTAQNGRMLDRDMLVRDIFHALLKNNLTCKAFTQPLYPDIDREYNLESINFRAGFSTDFSNSNENRKHNIKLALSKLNGTVMQPKQTFSFNKIVGIRGEKQGYRESKIIVNGKFVDGVGGGVCQVSTTLYNAAIRADMCILSVKNHSLPVGYVQPSMDAMVNSGTTDLKFENTTTHPVYIRAYSYNNQAVVEFYGTKMQYHIVPESEIVDSIPPPEDCEILVDTEYKYLPIDTPSGNYIQVSYSKGGLSSKGYLCYYDNNGNLVSRRHIRNDVYKAQKGLIAVAP